MHSFTIDFYLWYELLEDWLFVPPFPSSLPWHAQLTQSEILKCGGGLTFRINKVLWLGNERDLFPLDLVFHELENTLERNAPIGKTVASLPVSQRLFLKINLHLNEKVLLSRFTTSKKKDYLEKVAQDVGIYYQNFAIDRESWEQAVNKALNGLAVVFAHSKKSPINPEDQALASCLLERYNELGPWGSKASLSSQKALGYPNKGRVKGGKSSRSIPVGLRSTLRESNSRTTERVNLVQ